MFQIYSSSNSVQSNGLIVEQVSFSYQNQSVLLDVSFQVQPGKVVALLGKNGSGKSTTLSLAAGLLAPEKGNITFNGMTTYAGSETFRSHLGVSFDRLPDFGSLTVKEILEFSARLRNFNLLRDLRIVLEDLSLENYIDLPVNALSRGIQQKLGVLLATFHNPDLILLDEPSAGLDPFSLLQIRTILKSAAERGAAVLISTHALDEVHRVSDQIYIISKGKIVAHGTSQEIAEQVGEKVQLILETHPQLIESDCDIIFKNITEIVETNLRDSRVIIQLSAANSADRKLRTKISQRLYEKGYLITYMSQDLHQLESAFINLTEK